MNPSRERGTIRRRVNEMSMKGEHAPQRGCVGTRVMRVVAMNARFRITVESGFLSPWIVRKTFTIALEMRACSAL